MGKIVVADDHPAIVRLVQLALETDGHQVLTAYNGAAALRLVQEERPELVVLDVVMPELDGYRVLSRIKSDPELQHIPVLMLTVKSEPEDITLGVGIGADCYLTKPFNPSDIVSVVRRFFQTRPAEPPCPKPEG